MATLTDMPALESAFEASTGDDDDGSDNSEGNVFIFETAEDSGQAPQLTTENHTNYSIRGDFFHIIQPSLERQIQKSDPVVWKRISLVALVRHLKAGGRRRTSTLAVMADIRRLMFKNNIQTEYSDIKVPRAVFLALGYGIDNNYPRFNQHANEIIMWHEGFDNAALSRSQRKNPEKLVFKQHTLIATKLGATEWCTSKMWHRQLNALTAIRAAGFPQADPDHDEKLADVLALFKDSAVDAANPDHLKSLVVAWPLAQEVAQFVKAHTEFLIELCLNIEIANCIKRTAYSDSTKPDVEMLDKNFRGNQVIPIHPDALVEASGISDIIATGNANRGPPLTIEGSSQVAIDESEAAEMTARESIKAAQKARLKEKKTRSKEQKRIEKAEADSLKRAEFARKQQIKKDADIARQAEIDRKLQMSKEAHEAAELVKREEEELVRRQQAQKDADIARQMALDQKEKLSKEVNDDAELAKQANEAAHKQEMAKQANEAAHKQKMAKKKLDAKLAAAAILKDAELALQKASLEAQKASLDAQLAMIEQQAKETELFRAQQAIEQAAEEEEATIAQHSEQPHKHQAMEWTSTKTAPDSRKQKIVGRAEITEQRVASQSTRKTQILRRPVPDSALPRFPSQKTATKSTKRADTGEKNTSSFPAGPSPKMASTSDFPALSSSPTVVPKHAKNAASGALSFANAKVTGVPPKIESKAEFPKLVNRGNAPSTGTGVPPPVVSKEMKTAENTRAPARAVSTSDSPKLVGSDKTNITGSSNGSSGPFNQKTRRHKVAVPRVFDAAEQKPKDLEGRLDKPWRGGLSVNTNVAADISSKSPSSLSAETSPRDVAKTRVAEGEMQRRDSINFIRSRTDSRASMLQSPLAPTSQLPLTPVTGHNSPSAPGQEESAKAIAKQAKSDTATTVVSGGARGPLAMDTWAFITGSGPQSASAFDVGHAHPAPVFMSDEEMVTDRKELATQEVQAVVQHHSSVPPLVQPQFGNIAHEAHVNSNDDTSKNRTARIEADSKKILDSSKGRHNGGEILTLEYTKPHDQGGGPGVFEVVLPPNRGDRNRSTSLSRLLENSGIPFGDSDKSGYVDEAERECEDIPFEDSDEPGYVKEAERECEGSRRRSYSVNKSWKLTVPALDLAVAGCDGEGF